MHGESKSTWSDAVGRYINRFLAVAALTMVLGLGAVTDGQVQAQDQDATIENLLEQLDQLQIEGPLGMGLSERGSPLDQARDRGEGTTLDFNQRRRFIERQQALGGFSIGQQLLIQAHCEGTDLDQDVQALKLVPRFSRLERDYCRRAGEALLQFGYDLFLLGLAGPKTLMTGAVLDDYILGIGDEFVVTFHGQHSATVTTRVDREGRLLLPDLGAFPVLGRSFGTVRAEIEARTASALLGTSVFVSLGSVRQLSVVVAGEVVVPGAYQLTSLSTVLDALGGAGGIRKTGSLRRIQVRRGDRIFWIDAYDLLYGAGVAADLALFDGDYIVVPPIGLTVAIAGQVKRPGIYEVAEGASSMPLHKLLDLAGGTLRPRGNRFTHITFDDLGREQVSEQRDTAIGMRDGDMVIVHRVQDVQINTVDLVGHVRVVGSRPLLSAATARALIGDTTSLGDNPYLLFAAIETTDPVTRSRRLFPINLLAILAAQRDFKLRDGDKLIVLGNEDARFLVSRDVQNTLLKPDADNGRERKEDDSNGVSALAELESGPSSVNDLIASVSSGGDATIVSTSTSADQARGAFAVCAGLKRLAALVAGSRPGRFSVAVRTFGPEPDEADFVDEPCPKIYEQYPDLLALALEHVTAINGEVRIPGIYPILPETPLSHLLAVVGGTTREADLSRVEILRGSGNGAIAHNLIDLTSVDVRDITLSPGDLIRFSQVFNDRDAGPVEMAGEVVRPGFYQIRRGERLSEVVERAGGLTPQAYPFGAIFTRDRVRRAQQIGFERAARELNASLAVAAAQGDVNASSLVALFELTQGLSTTEALGRVVIEADPTVLQVRPELDSVLEPGDRLFVPKRPNSVLVIGDVLSPGALQFISGSKVDQYIRQAGGFQRSADEDRVFVVYPNGEAQPVSVSVWNYTPVQVPPGSTIVIPKDPAPLNVFQMTREVAAVISQLAITAASLAVIGSN